MKRDLTELDKLERYLKENGIRYERFDYEETFTDEKHPNLIYELERHQICVPCEGEDMKWDAICHRGSYGAEEGLLEIMGVIVRKNAARDTVEGYLEAAEDEIDTPTLFDLLGVAT